MPMTECQLIEKCRRQDRKAQKELYELYARKMLSVCMRYSNDVETARDLLQEGFIKVFTSLDSFQFAGSLEGWIRRIMVNTALEYLRRHDLLRDAVDITDCSTSVSSGCSALEALSAEDLMKLVRNLPPGFRAVFNLYAIEGYSHKEIAEMLGITDVTSRTQYSRAKKILQKQILKIETINSLACSNVYEER